MKILDVWRRAKRARAKHYLDMCLAANEVHPGLYDDLVAKAEAALKKLA